MPIYRPVRQKPPFGTLLNRSHPLAKYVEAFWLFNEYSGGVVHDYSGNGYHGVETGAGVLSWDADGMVFDGTNYLDCGYINMASWPQATLIAKYTVTDLTNNNCVCTNNSFNRAYLELRHDKFDRVSSLSCAENTALLVESSGSSPEGEYTSGATYDSDILRVFIDDSGFIDDDVTGVGPLDSDNSIYKWFIGSSERYPAYSFYGTIEWIVLLKKALIWPEILNFRAAPFEMFRHKSPARYFYVSGGGGSTGIHNPLSGVFTGVFGGPI